MDSEEIVKKNRELPWKFLLNFEKVKLRLWKNFYNTSKIRYMLHSTSQIPSGHSGGLNAKSLSILVVFVKYLQMRLNQWYAEHKPHGPQNALGPISSTKKRSV